MIVLSFAVRETPDTLKRLAGQAAIVSGFISFCGPLTEKERKDFLEQTVRADLQGRGIPIAENCDPLHVRLP